MERRRPEMRDGSFLSRRFCKRCYEREACLSLSDNELSAEINSQKAQVATLLRRVGHALSTHVSIYNKRTCVRATQRDARKRHGDAINPQRISVSRGRRRARNRRTLSGRDPLGDSHNFYDGDVRNIIVEFYIAFPFGPPDTLFLTKVPR